MKKLIIIVLSLSLIFTAGCTFKRFKTTSNQEVTSNRSNIQQMKNNPEFALQRTLMEIERLDRGSMPVTKEQGDKLIPILNDIKAQSTIEKQYADDKSSQITAIFTEEQKQSLANSQRPQNGTKNNKTDGGQNIPQGVAPNDNQSNGNMTPPPVQPNAGEQNSNDVKSRDNNMNGNNGASKNRQQVSINDLCERIIQSLSQKK